MIRPDRAGLAEEEAFRFRHMLIRDAAYRSLSKEMRAALHERFAAWVVRTAGSRLGEFEEIVGYHLEQAYRLLGELGALDVEAEELAVAGGTASRGAKSARAERPHGGGQPARTRRRPVPDDHARRARLLPDVGAALIEAGRLADSNQVLTDASQAAAAANDECAGARTLVQQEFLRLRGESAGTAEGLAVVERVIPVFERG